MSGDVSGRKRLISINGANLRNAHIYISGHHDFFPEDDPGTKITLIVDGLPEPVETEIARDGMH